VVDSTSLKQANTSRSSITTLSSSVGLVGTMTTFLVTTRKEAVTLPSLLVSSKIY
jgi:hypothetical protein